MRSDDARPKPAAQPASGPDLTRRRLLAAAAAACTAAPALARAAQNADDPRRQPARPGDVLAFPSWEGEGRPVAVDDVPAGGPPLTVYPADAVTGVVRERSRLNQILLVRFEVQALGDDLRARAVDGILAYSGVCTHAACGVSEWDAAAGHLVCPCHASAFDPLRAAAVVNGPATRALPALPLRLEAGRLVIDGAFTGPVGAAPA